MTIPKRCKRNLERGHPTVSQYTAGGRHPSQYHLNWLSSNLSGSDGQINRLRRCWTNIDFEIGQRIPERIEEDFHGFLLPTRVARIRLGGPWNKILTQINRPWSASSVPPKPNFRTPRGGWPDALSSKESLAQPPRPNSRRRGRINPSDRPRAKYFWGGWPAP